MAEQGERDGVENVKSEEEVAVGSQEQEDAKEGNADESSAQKANGVAEKKAEDKSENCDEKDESSVPEAQGKEEETPAAPTVGESVKNVEDPASLNCEKEVGVPVREAEGKVEESQPASTPEETVKDEEDTQKNDHPPKEEGKPDPEQDKTESPEAPASSTTAPEEIDITEPLRQGTGVAAAATDGEGEGKEGAAKANSSKVNFTGKWKSNRAENFEEYLKAVGVNFVMRKIAVRASPMWEFNQDGDHFVFKMSTGFFSQEAEFNIGEEYETGTPLGARMKNISHWDGDKLVTESKPKEENSNVKSVSSTREIVDGELIVTLKVGEVIGKRFFTKIG